MNALRYIAATVEPVSRDWETTLASYYTWITNDVRRAGIHFEEYRDDFHGITKMELVTAGRGDKSVVVVIGADSVEIDFKERDPSGSRWVPARRQYYRRYPSLRVFNRAAARDASDAIKQFFASQVHATVEPGQHSAMYNLIQSMREHNTRFTVSVNAGREVNLPCIGTSLNHDRSVSAHFSGKVGNGTYLSVKVSALLNGRTKIEATLSDAGGHLDDTEFDVPHRFKPGHDCKAVFTELLQDAVEWGVDNA